MSWHGHAWLLLELARWSSLMKLHLIEVPSLIRKSTGTNVPVDFRLSSYVRQSATRLVGRQFTLQQDNDPKHTASATKEFITRKKWIILEWPSQSPNFNPIEHAFYMLKKKMASEYPRNKEELKQAAVKAWQSISTDYTKTLVHSMQRRLNAVIINKGYATKY